MEAGSICGQGGGGSGAVDIWGVGGGVVVQNRNSPDFRSPRLGSLRILWFDSSCSVVPRLSVVCEQLITQQH